MPKETRLPAVAAGRQGGEFYVADTPSLVVHMPQGDSLGFLGCDEDSTALAYGRMALADFYGYPLNTSQVLREHGIYPEYWEAALDGVARIHMQNMGHQFEDLPDVEVVSGKQHALQIVRGSALGRKAKDSILIQFTDGVRESIEENFRDHARVLSLVKSLQDFLESTPDNKGNPASGEGESRDEDEPQEGAMQYYAGLGKYLNHSSDGDAWDKMHIFHCPLPRSVVSAACQLRPRPGFTGAFRYPLRAAIPVADGRAFGQRKRVAGGTILFDVSGSMHLEQEQVYRMIEERPALTVATYGADHSDNPATLRIVASKGRMADRQHFISGQCNRIDGPALKWLSKQKMPRIWVSDGAVNGKAMKCGIKLIAEATKLVREGRITQFISTEQYLRRLYAKKQR